MSTEKENVERWMKGWTPTEFRRWIKTYYPQALHNMREAERLYGVWTATRPDLRPPSPWVLYLCIALGDFVLAYVLSTFFGFFD